IGRTWLIIAGVSFLLICTSGSILWWQGQKILDNYQAISEQKDALTKLNAQTWGVRFQTTSDGRHFLVMPAGTTPEAIPYNGTTWVQLKQD
ncbi:mobilization protein, partial [Enterobacter hormaechei]